MIQAVDMKTWVCRKCGLENDTVLEVEFKDGTTHYEMRCDCSLICQGYIKKTQERYYKKKDGQTQKNLKDRGLFDV